jgi:hypothetical protein
VIVAAATPRTGIPARESEPERPPGDRRSRQAIGTCDMSRLPLRLRLPWPALGAPPGLPLPRLPRLPLPATATVIGLLLLLPSIGIGRWPRPRAEGLEQLMASVTLLQSFPATPERPLPALWRERFGLPLADALWRGQRGQWWQFWGPHADVAPYLAISATALQGGGNRGTLPPHALRVGDLLVVAPDPLSRQILQDRLRPRLRPSKGLQSRCLAMLQKEQAVFWNPLALGVIVGPVAPLLQRFQEGCVRLELEPAGLAWQGEAAAVDGVLTTAKQPAMRLDLPVQAPLPGDLLLELEGASLEQLFQGLISRELIREPLASRYGIDRSRLALLRQAPFRLRLRPQSKGTFQASLELQVMVGGRRKDWEQILIGLARALQEQGLDDRSGLPPLSPASPPLPGKPAVPPPSLPAAPELPSPVPRRGPAQPALAATWSRADGVAVGGWRWIIPARGPAQLLLFLGPVPRLPLPMASGDPHGPGKGGLLLRARPTALDALGLLPPEMPQLVRQSEQLWIDAAPQEGLEGQEPISLLRGRLRLGS